MRIVLLTDNMQEFEFATNEVTLGRADDNVLQLDYTGVSRYHGKILHDNENGKSFVYDFESTNGILVNGVKIKQSAEIKDDDILQLHNVKLQISKLKSNNSNATKIIFSEITLESTPVAPIAPVAPVINTEIKNEPAVSEIITVDVHDNNEKNDIEISNFSEYLKSNEIFKKGNSKKSHNSDEQSKNSKFKLSNITFIIIVVCLVVMGFMLFLIVEKNAKDTKNIARTAAETTPAISDNVYLIYTKESIEADNIYRFHLLIENNKAYFTIDELQSQLSVGPIEKKISEIDISKIRQGISDSDFFSIKDNYIGLSTSSERKMKELSVFVGNKNNTIRVENSSAPREFLDLEETINNYILDAELPYLTLSSEELAAKAKDSFYHAEDLLANYEANYNNLKEAINEYTIVINYLAGFSPEPQVRKIAVNQIDRATKTRSDLYDQLRAEYDTFVSKKDFLSAKNAAAKIMQLFDMDTQEYEFFRNKSIQIDDILRKNQSKR